MRFPYGEYPITPRPTLPEGGTIFRPVIPLSFTGSRGSKLFYGLVDTGADETVLTQQMADLIGIESPQEKNFSAISASGKFPIWYAKITLEISLGDESYHWETTVAVADQMWEEAILGHLGFLNYFDAKFFGEDHLIELARNGTPLPTKE